MSPSWPHKALGGGENASGSIRSTSYLHLQLEALSPLVISTKFTSAILSICRWRLHLIAFLRDALTSTVPRMEHIPREHLVSYFLCLLLYFRLVLTLHTGNKENRSDICMPQEVGRDEIHPPFPASRHRANCPLWLLNKLRGTCGNLGCQCFCTKKSSPGFGVWLNQ